MMTCIWQRLRPECQTAQERQFNIDLAKLDTFKGEEWGKTL